MNFGELQTKIRESIGAVAGELDTEIAGFANDAIADLHSESHWPWNRDSTSIRAMVVLSGTCTYTNGLTSVVLNTGGATTTALAALYQAGVIQLAGGSIYEVTAYDQGTQTLTLDSEIVEADALSADGVYSFAQDTITLPSNVATVIQVVDHLTPCVLEMIPTHKRKRRWPDPFLGVGSRPDSAWVRGVSPTGHIEMGVYPPPSENRTYYIEFWSRLALPASDSDELEAATGIPERFHPVLVARGKMKAYEFEDESDSKRSLAAAEYFQGVTRMKQHCKPDVGAVLQMQSGRRNRSSHYDDHTEITGV